MNLAESVKYVLKAKSQHLATEFWRDDLSGILKEFGRDVSLFFKSGKDHVIHFKKAKIKISPREVLSSAGDVVAIVRIVPKRVKNGFSYFKDDFIKELEGQPDQKQKTIFCLKVLGTLSSFIIGIIYNLKIGKADLKFVGIKPKNAFTQLLIAELIIKMSQVLIVRFLNEVEKQVDDPSELNNIKYFKALLSDRQKMEQHSEKGELPPESNDPSIAIVDDLKNYILTGTRGSHSS